MCGGTRPARYRAYLSGCDSVSSFAGKGKKTWIKLIDETPLFLSTLQKIGATPVEESLVTEVERVVCELYGCSCTSVNKARYLVFCSTACEERQLPPTRDALCQHIKRASFQASVWRQASPSPLDHGWKNEDGVLLPVWMTGPSAPSCLTELVRCSCKKSGCQSQRCSCSLAKLPCTNMCKCVGCANRPSADETEAV